MRFNCQILLAVLFFASTLCGSLRAQEEEVFFSSFDFASIDGVTGEIIDDEFTGEATTVGQALNAASLQLDPEGGSLLSMTQATNNQSGFAWFNQAFNLRDNKVIVDFDYYIRSGTSADPADGLSVIFQFGNNLNATGQLGGNLGTGNFPTPYVSVAMDIWHNAADPETACHAGNNRSCHVEVNQNNAAPISTPAVKTNVEQGVPVPSFTEVGDLLIPSHARITFDNGEIIVELTIDDPAYADFNGNDFTEGVVVVRTTLVDFPDPAEAIIGFAASTGAANAHHEIDNLRIAIDDPTPRIIVHRTLGDGTRGAMNLGGATEVTGLVDGEAFTFVPDIRFGTNLGSNTEIVPQEEYFADYGHDVVPNIGTVAAAISNLDDAALEPVYQTEAWMNGALAYRFGVEDGRYEVNLHFSENCACGVNALGEGTRRYTVRLEGQEGLTWFSPGEAAGQDTGVDTGVLNTAVRRTFEVDVEDGYLNLSVGDLGVASNPPENAQINGISYRRIGDASGGGLTGDIQDASDAVAPLLPVLIEEELVTTDFEDDPVGGCPDNWTCNGTATTVVDFSDAHALPVSQRLRLTDNVGSLGNTAIYNEAVNLDEYDFVAEFDVLVTADVLNGNPPADGMAFFFVPGDDAVLTSTGSVGGGMGYTGMGTGGGFAVEIDTWANNGQGGADGPGFNIGNTGHFELTANMSVDVHRLHSDQFNADLDDASNWPFSLIEDSADPDYRQFRFSTADLESDGTAGLHLRVEKNNGRLRVWASTVNQDDSVGVVFPETLVVDTFLGWGAPALGEGYFGFSAGTGGAVSWHEVDNVEITLTRTRVLEVRRLVSTDLYDVNTTGIDVTLNIDLDDAAPTPLSVVVTEELPDGWDAESISDGGVLADGVITWSLADISADTPLTYRLVPPEGANRSVSLVGTFNVDGTVSLETNVTSIGYAPLPFGRGEPEEFVNEQFELGDFPPDLSANGGSTDPNATLPMVDPFTGRLRMAQDGIVTTGTSAFFTEPVDLTEYSFTAEFDAFFYSTVGDIADGLLFAVTDASVNAPTDVGAAGGGMGYQGLSGFAVEIDLWQGPDTGPSGYNPGLAERFGHVAVVKDGDVAEHVQTMLDYNPELRPLDIDPLAEGWPTIVDETGGDGSDQALRFRIEYNNGNIEAFISAADTLGGPAVDDLQILDTVVTFESGAGDGEPILPSGYLGFTAGTGSAHATMEIDNLLITLYPKTDGPAGPQFRRGDVDGSGVVDISDPIANLTNQFLGGPIPCRDAADYNDSGAVDISDPIANLTNQFLGGPPAAPPGSDTCGPDPTPDAGADGGDLGCENPPTNC